MKKLKKLLAVLVTVAMAIGMLSMSAFAADDGSITIDNSKTGSTYSIYKVFDATYSGENVAYTYDGTNATFLAALQGADSPFKLTKNSNNTYNVEAKENATGESIATFLKAQEKNLGNAVKTASGTGQAVKVEGLAYGYYYVTTTTGSAVTIDSAVKDVTVIDKNTNTPEKPEKTETVNEVEKQDSATASIGDTVSYEITGTVKRYGVATEGADAVKVTKLKYVDTMSAGLTLDKNVVVKIGDDTLVSGTDYTVNYNGQVTTIEIPMTRDDGSFIYAEGASISITYSGTLNDNAVVAGDGNSNTVELKWNDSNSSGTDTTKVYTYSFDLVKDNKDKNVLTGAQFTLKKGDTTIYFTKDSNGNYKVTPSTTEGATSTIDAGYVKITGLGNGTYTLTETKAPEGYNVLERPVTVTVNNANNDAVLTTTRDTDGKITSQKYVSGGVEVTNQAGASLPTTGGMGTTIFYVLGAAFVIGAGIVLVTRRKLSK